jgi:pimeloyl-ACP methyl ester carboxylesterase
MRGELHVPKIQVNGVELHCQQMGEDGNTVVMIHGLFASLAFWYLSVMPMLAGRHRVTAYDLRGHGYSDVTDAGYTSADMAGDLGGLLDQLGINRAHLVAHSFGGSVALQYALLHPDRVLSLTLADVWVASLQPQPLAWDSASWRDEAVNIANLADRPEALPKVANDAYAEWLRLQGRTATGGFDAWVESALLSQWNSDSRVAKRWFQLVRTTSAAKEMCEVADLTPNRLRTLHCPALAMFGEYSGCLPTLRGLEEHLPSCRTVMIPGAGHLYPLIRPDLFVQHVTEFIGSVPL